ncbi:MAG: c-type cytochrome [Gammaproteobacteria bacterium]|jgi:cytochrome c553
MNKLVSSIAAMILAGGAGAALAGDAAAGKTVYDSKGCAGCHGANAISAVPMYPNLAGQKAQYVVLALKAYKAGERNSANAAAMKPMAAMLSDADIDNVSAYLESLK